jgi:hypothetical protein
MERSGHIDRFVFGVRLRLVLLLVVRAVGCSLVVKGFA